MGNSLHHTGYGCELPSMVSDWRSKWSAVSGTTDPEAYFGTVTLAAGGSEGHGANMADMRWAQTANCEQTRIGHIGLTQNKQKHRSQKTHKSCARLHIGRLARPGGV